MAQGSDDMYNTWRARAIAPLANHPSYVAVSTRKIRIGSYETGVYEAATKPTGDEFLEIISPREGDDLILIGRSNSMGKVKAFRLPRSKVDGLESVGKGVDTGVGSYDPLTDCCCLVAEAGNEKQRLLMVEVKGKRKNEAKLSLCYLD